MTLVLTLLTARYVLQVSDRLVTETASCRPFDPLANKNVIYHARDAIVSIGYSGLAYLEGVPTDQWIAQKLRGEDSFFQSPKRWNVKMARATRWLDIGQSVELLRQECQTVFSRPTADVQPQEIIVAGWQWSRGRTRPIAWWIGNTGDPPDLHTFHAENLPRHWQWARQKEQPDSRPYNLLGIPSSNPSKPLTERERGELGKRVASATWSPTTSEQELINAIRLAARRPPHVVGPHCMCILLPPPSRRSVLVRYAPLAETRAVVSMGHIKADVPVAFSPWVVGFHTVVAPSIVAGSRPISVDDFAVLLEAPDLPPGTGLLSWFGSQPRPPDPRHRT